jgi:hypothetical protein
MVKIRLLKVKRKKKKAMNIKKDSLKKLMDREKKF